MSSRARKIVDAVEYIVSLMTPTVLITDNQASGDNWELTICDTYWIRPGDTVTIGVLNFTVVSFVINESITVSGAAQPIGTSFTLSAPAFWHSSYRKVNTERKREQDVSGPFVYLPQARTRLENTYDSDMEYYADIRPIFLLNYYTEKDNIEQQQNEAIDPANQMADYFIDIIEANEGDFNRPEGVSRKEWMNFGDETVWGNDKLIFDQRLSGVELDFRLEVLVNALCSCDVFPAGGCEDVTTDVNGVNTAAETASGQHLAINVIDQNDAPLGVVTVDTANVKTVQVNTAGSPSGVDLNAAPLTDVQSGNTKAMTITYADSSPVVITTVTDTETVFSGTVPNNVTPLNVANPTKTGQVTSFYAGDDGTTQRGRGADFDTLASNNPFGNTNRFTDTLGGSSYANNVLIDWESYDQVTGVVLAYKTTVEPLSTYVNACINAPYTHAGHADWYIWNFNEFSAVCRHEYVSVGRMSWLDYAPFNINESVNLLWIGTVGNRADHGLVFFNAGIASNANTLTRNFVIVRYYTLAELGL